MFDRRPSPVAPSPARAATVTSGQSGHSAMLSRSVREMRIASSLGSANSESAVCIAMTLRSPNGTQ